MTGILYLEDGTVYKGKGFGAAATNVGELVFNTAMAGYQEILTDPTAAGQVINMTYPLIGNYGVSLIDNQSERIHAFGLIAHDISLRPSNRCSVMSISEWLDEQGVPGIHNLDTRAITKKIRTNGTCKCVISTEGISKERAHELIDETEPSTGFEYRTRIESIGTGLKVAVIDLGIKKCALDALTGRGCKVKLFPPGTASGVILAAEPDGLFLSDGPGAPDGCGPIIKTTAELMRRLPVFGTGLGHLVTARAAGGKTYKMLYGHRGINHGIEDTVTGKTYITSQNHGYAVEAESLRGSGFEVSYINLNDGTVEGMKHESLPVFTSAFSPEGGPGPNDAEALYDRFIAMMGGDLNA